MEKRRFLYTKRPLSAFLEIKLYVMNISIEKAKRIQKKLSKKVEILPLRSKISYVGGVDVSVKGDVGVACVVVMDYPYLREVEVSTAKKEIRFPYIPGLLSFREGPVIIKAIKNLSVKPDVFIFDGQGIAHPRGIGIATHVGVLLKISTIGCAKSVLCGIYKEPDIKKGSWSPLIYNGKKIGVALRTRTGVKPVFVSVGNRIELEQCIEIVLNCCTKYRLPEPIRRAHIIAGEKNKRHEAALL